ncbi:MAG TPA: protein-disulfide reductase DsbD domain-containing protein, partial [Magnetospirillum sp.]|nr:protein-disulfide reductase DsbD domain-containing protein [Magnetospirillum sp.]
MVLALAAVLAATFGVARAAEPGASDWAATETGKVRLIAATTATGDAASLKMGLHFRLEPGWKIYWRTPGDAGYPPKVSWTGSENIGTPAIWWPAPKRFQLAGLQNHGYSGEVVLPLDVPVTRPGQPVRVAASLDYLACAQICVPMQAALTLALPSGSATPSAFVHDLGRFTALVPGDGARHGLTVETVEAVGDGDASALRVALTATEPFDHPDLFVEPAELASFDAPKVTLSQGGRRAVIEAAVAPGTLQRPLAGAPLTVTVVDGSRSLEAVAIPVPGRPSAPADTGGASLLPMVLVALLGGVILNLMPCVLPVLSIKLLGALSHGGAARGHVR